MFDRLIVCEPAGADFKNRRSYFMVSSLVVGVLFATAVVISIYAADIGLGRNDLELVELIAPPEMAPEQPETPRPQVRNARPDSAIQTRQVNMLRIDEMPTAVPVTTSVVKNTQLERPSTDRFVVTGVNSGPATGQSSGRDTPGGGPTGPGLTESGPQVADNQAEVEPPPVKKDPPPVKKIVSGGVVNGNALDLPKPVYSAAARAVNAQGKVDVQVLIDEGGRVISANAVNGHILLRPAAEQAARRARFTPTLLSKVAVKVTGIIVYNFTK